MVTNFSELPQEVTKVTIIADAPNKNLAVNLQTPTPDRPTATPGYHLPATIITGLPDAKPHPKIETPKPDPTPHATPEAIKPDAKTHLGDEGARPPAKLKSGDDGDKTEAKLKSGGDGDKTEAKLDLKKDDEIKSDGAKPPKKGDKADAHDPKKPDDDKSDKGDHGKAHEKLHDAIKDKDGVKLSEVLGKLKDEDVRSDLSKVIKDTNKKIGGSSYLATGVDDKNIHLYSMSSDGGATELYSRPYDPATDAAHATTFDPNQVRQELLKDTSTGSPSDKAFADSITGMNDTQLRLFAAIRNKDGPEIRAALTGMNSEQVGSQLSPVLKMFNSPSTGTPVVVSAADDKDGLQVKMSWKGLTQGKGVVLYSGTIPVPKPDN